MPVSFLKLKSEIGYDHSVIVFLMGTATKMPATACPTHYRTRHSFSDSNTNEDIAMKFEQEYVRCVKNEKECVRSAPNCCDTEQQYASQPGSAARGTHCTMVSLRTVTFLSEYPRQTTVQYTLGHPSINRPRHFFNNSNTNEDIATKFEQEYVRCVRNEKECVCSAPDCCDMEQRSASQPVR